MNKLFSWDDNSITMIVSFFIQINCFQDEQLLENFDFYYSAKAK